MNLNAKSEMQAVTIDVFKAVLPALIAKGLPDVAAADDGTGRSGIRRPTTADYVRQALEFADEAVRQLAERYPGGGASSRSL